MRGPPPGTPKTPGSGRRKGTPNKVNVQTREALWQAIARLEAQGIEANPFLVLLTTMVTTADEHVRLHAATALSDRLLPKLKATEHNGEITQHILTGEQRRARIEELLVKRNGHAH